MNDSMRAESNGLSIAGLIFGILAVLGSFTIVATPFLASLAIMFSCLSRGDKKMCGQAKAGSILAVLSIFISIIVAVILAVALASVIRDFISSFLDMYVPLIQQYLESI